MQNQIDENFNEKHLLNIEEIETRIEIDPDLDWDLTVYEMWLKNSKNRFYYQIIISNPKE